MQETELFKECWVDFKVIRSLEVNEALSPYLFNLYVAIKCFVTFKAEIYGLILNYGYLNMDILSLAWDTRQAKMHRKSGTKL